MYCSYCAAVIDPTQTFCPRCGRPVPVAATPGAPSSVVVGAPVDTRPFSVRTAVILLAVTWVIGLMMFAVATAMYPSVIRSISYLFQTAVFSLAWISLVVCLWQRQNWARIGVLILIVWSVGSVALTLIRFAGAMASFWGFAVTILEDIIRVIALFLLFRPESNAWFKK